ncbi:MAG: alpha/beta hydrolase, partial [Culicoidibacterales bacterium]
YDYTLDVSLLPSADEGTNYVILNHDFGENKLASLAYYQLFHDLGFNVVIYSARGHGESGGGSTGYGYFEKYDLQAIINTILEQSPEAVIGLHGVGLGAATVIEYAEIASLEIDFYIAQSSFSDLATFFQQKLAQTYPDLLRSPIQTAITFWLETFQQIPVASVSPVNTIREIPQPILLIYGTNDPALVFSEPLLTAVSEPFGESYLVEGATAQTIATVGAQRYKETIKNFIVASFDK